MHEDDRAEQGSRGTDGVGAEARSPGVRSVTSWLGGTAALALVVGGAWWAMQPPAPPVGGGASPSWSRTSSPTSPAATGALRQAEEGAARKDIDDPGQADQGELLQGSRYPVFGVDDVFRQRVPSAPLHPQSKAMVRHLVGQITSRYGGVASLNVSQYNPSLVVARADTPAVDVAFDNCQKKASTPSGLFDGDAHFKGIPIPDDAVPAKGTDGALSIYRPDTDQLWELWKARKRPDGTWQACWGGRIDQVSANPGFFTTPWGVSASGLATVGSMITLPEAKNLRIEHAIGVGIPHPAHWSKVNYPAQRSDGSSRDPAALPEGTRLRLPKSVKVEALGLTPIATAIAQAAQEYGFLIVDTSGAVAVVAEADPQELRPSSGGAGAWSRVLGGTPAYAQLKGFPWDKLEVIAPNWGRPGD